MFRKEALDRLSSLEELDELMRVTTPRSWLALLALGSLLVVALLWGLFTTIPTTIAGRGSLTAAAGNAAELQATVYVGIDDGRQIQPGMPVKLALARAPKEQWGVLLGTVTAVADVPSDQEGMRGSLGNDAYAQALAGAGLIVPVQVQFVRDPATPSGYKWSSPQGPPMPLQKGMLCQGTITINEQRAISLMLR
ncbi:MAG TPA: hypothetical protein PLO33_02255 [Kouleothrix sp.]|jgi:hypothetical protein|uniref:hypothetical protein n=1 Tax=Kouleothrix sp. TaxID=2779161 RepID=UPI002B9AD70D|nr:hypothetical protein [Kouleothrix sp.]HRC74468.1 hypothetical protein [Kouleothrix sp.]